MASLKWVKFLAENSCVYEAKCAMHLEGILSAQCHENQRKRCEHFRDFWSYDVFFLCNSFLKHHFENCWLPCLHVKLVNRGFITSYNAFHAGWATKGLWNQTFSNKFSTSFFARNSTLSKCKKMCHSNADFQAPFSWFPILCSVVDIGGWLEQGEISNHFLVFLECLNTVGMLMFLIDINHHRPFVVFSIIQHKKFQMTIDKCCPNSGN